MRFYAVWLTNKFTGGSLDRDRHHFLEINANTIIGNNNYDRRIRSSLLTLDFNSHCLLVNARRGDGTFVYSHRKRSLNC